MRWRGTRAFLADLEELRKAADDLSTAEINAAFQQLDEEAEEVQYQRLLEDARKPLDVDSDAVVPRDQMPEGDPLRPSKALVAALLSRHLRERLGGRAGVIAGTAFTGPPSHRHRQARAQWLLHQRYGHRLPR